MKRFGFPVVVSVAVSTATPAFAEAGLPQLDVTLFPEQLVWLGISFAMLYLLMRYVALPGVKRTQDNRQALVESDLYAAKTSNEAAKDVAAQTEKALAEARAAAQTTVSTIKTEASKAAAEQQAAQQKQLAARLQQAEAGIAATRDAAFKEVEGVVAGLAAAIMEKVRA